MTLEQSMANHPAGKARAASAFLSPTSEENPLMVPARLITSGDHFWGMSVPQTRNMVGGDKMITMIIPRTAHGQTLIVEADALDEIYYPVTKRGDSHSPAARNIALGVPVEKDAPAPYVAPEPVAVYPVGTRIGDVEHFDRGMKVAFHCPRHPTNVFYSKDPFSSRWFGEGDLICECNTRDYVTTHEYKPTRNG